MTSRPHRIPWLAVGVAVAACWISANGYDAAWIRERGPDWRWLTGHLVHHGGAHLWPNALAFLALGALAESQWGARRLAGIVLTIAVGVAAGLAPVDPELARYAGLSGINAGLAAVIGAVWLGRPPLRLAGALVLAGLAAYLAADALCGPRTFGVTIRSVPAAHLLGATAGLAISLGPGVAKISKRTLAHLMNLRSLCDHGFGKHPPEPARTRTPTARGGLSPRGRDFVCEPRIPFDDHGRYCPRG